MYLLNLGNSKDSPTAYKVPLNSDILSRQRSILRCRLLLPSSGYIRRLRLKSDGTRAETRFRL